MKYAAIGHRESSRLDWQPWGPEPMGYSTAVESSSFIHTPIIIWTLQMIIRHSMSIIPTQYHYQ